MAASMRLLARFYINAPKTQTTASLLGGRSNYSKDAAGSVSDDEQKDASTQQSGDTTSTDVLTSAVQNVARMSSDPQQAQKIERDLQERLRDIPRFARQRQAPNSIVKRLIEEATEATRNQPVRGEASESRTRFSRAGAADSVGGLLVDRQRSAATQRAASSSRRPGQESPSSTAGHAVQQQQKQQQVPSSLAGHGSVKEQLMNEQRLASRTVSDHVPRSRQAVADADPVANGGAARRSLDPAAVEQAGRKLKATLASILSMGAPSSSSGASSSIERDGSSERLQPQGESVMTQLLRNRVGSMPRAQPLRPQQGRAGAAPAAAASPGDKGDATSSAISEQFSDILHRVVHESATAQAEDTRKSLSILEQLRGPRADNQQPRSFPSGGYRDRDVYKLFEGDRLNIFRPEKWPVGVQESKWNSLWASHVSDAASSAAHLPPSNAFEEHIQWTREGKLWTFPIDNEAGMDHEKSVPFYEHIFLEKHLANFPKKGPVRHFMELVVNGLSKNPFITVEEKVSHIKWFENYFSEKKKLLDEHLPEQQQAGKDVD